MNLLNVKATKIWKQYLARAATSGYSLNAIFTGQETNTLKNNKECVKDSRTLNKKCIENLNIGPPVAYRGGRAERHVPWAPKFRGGNLGRGIDIT